MNADRILCLERLLGVPEGTGLLQQGDHAGTGGIVAAQFIAKADDEDLQACSRRLSSAAGGSLLRLARQESLSFEL